MKGSKITIKFISIMLLYLMITDTQEYQSKTEATGVLQKKYEYEPFVVKIITIIRWL